MNILRYEIEMPCLTDFGCVGIDPGTVNLGIAFLMPGCYSVVYQIRLERFKSPVERITFAHSLLRTIINMERDNLYSDLRCIIEGASFGDTHRQVELAEQRAAFVIAGQGVFYGVKMLAPLTIRKLAFGTAKILAKDTYQEIPQDAAVAVSCAVAAERTHW